MNNPKQKGHNVKLSEKYIESVISTKSSDYERIKERLSDSVMIDMLHAAMGMVTEANELLDMVKKHIFYGKPFDVVNVIEELGDSNWYNSLAIDTLRRMGYKTSWEEIWDTNIKKLCGKRYKNGKFTESRAINRDIKAERKVLEKR